MSEDTQHDPNRGRTVGAEQSESIPILPPGRPLPSEGPGACEDPACPGHGAAVRALIELPPPADLLLPIDAAPFVQLAERWESLALTLETEALIAHSRAVDVAEESGADAVDVAEESARLLDRAAVSYRSAAAIRTCRSDLVRALLAAGVGLALFVAGCVAPADATITIPEACAQYGAEVEPCGAACPWEGREGACDVEQVSACAEATRGSCRIATNYRLALCAQACEVSR